MTGEISMDISRSYIYKHTQLMGWPFIVLIVAGAIASIVIGLDHGGVIALIVGFILMVVLILFGALTVTVDDQGVRVDFGPGLIHAAFSDVQIKSCRVVRDKWYYGWGFRIIPRGILYNIYGLDAVELLLADGRMRRIGTDEPEKLNGAINQILARRPGLS